jgi:hypothetical protein
MVMPPEEKEFLLQFFHFIRFLAFYVFMVVSHEMEKTVDQ